MAKATLLQIVQKIQENLGESQSSSLTGLSGLNLMIFNTINEVLYDLGSTYKFKPLEANISITLGNGTSTYANTYLQYDKDSFRYDNARLMTWRTAQGFDRNNVVQTNSGVPTEMFDWGGYFNVYPIPNAAAAGKVIRGRGWSYPTLFTTATATATCWIPEGFDLTLLCDLVTYKILHYKSNPEWQFYLNKVNGNKDMEGSLPRMQRLFGSPDLLDGQIMVEPMGQEGVRGGIVQSPITG